MADEVIFKLIVDLGDSEKQVDAFQKKLEQLKKEMQSAFRDLKFDLPDFSGFGDGILPSISGIISKASSLFLSGFKSIFDGIVSLAQSAFSLIGDVISGAFEGLKGSIKNSIELEDAMSGVKRTANLTGEQIETLTKNVREMSNSQLKGAIAADDLANILETAGQRGLIAGDNFEKTKEIALEFTKGVAMTAGALDLSFQKTADSLGKFASLMGMTADDIGKVGNAINVLSDTTNAASKNIVDMAGRLAPVAASFKLSAADTLGFSAAMDSLGVSSYTGATALQTAFKQMTSNVDGFAEVFSLDVNKLRTLIQTDIGGAFEYLLQGVDKMAKETPDGVEKVSLALKELQISGAGVSTALLGLAGMGGELQSQFLDPATKSITNMDSITKEFGNTTSRASSLWGSIGEIFVNTAGQFTDALIPVFDEALTYIRDIALEFSEWIVSQGIIEDLKISVVALWNDGLKPLVASLVGWASNSEELKSFLAEDIPTAIQSVISWITQAIQKVDEWLPVMIDYAVQAWETLKTIVSVIGEIITAINNSEGVKTFFSEGIPSAINTAIIAFEVIVTSIQAIQSAVEYLQEISMPFFQFWVDAVYEISDAWEKLLEWIDKIGEAWNWLSEKLGIATNETNENIQKVQEQAQQSIDAMSALSPTVDGMFAETTQTINDTTQAIEQIPIQSQEAIQSTVGIAQQAINTIQTMPAQTQTAIDTALNGIDESNITTQTIIAQTTDSLIGMGETAKQVSNEIAQNAQKVAEETSQAIEQITTTQQTMVANAATAAKEGFTSATPGNTDEWKSVYSDLNDLMAKQKELYPAIESSAKASSTQIAKLANGVYANVPYMGILDDMQAGIGENAKEIEKLGYWTGKASDAIKIMGDEAVYNSVFPDISTAIKANETDLQSLSNTITNATGYLNSLGESANSAISKVNEIAASSLGTTVSNVTNNTTNTTNTATTESLGGGETTKEMGTSTTVNISFEGTNIIDESSEDRFIRKIATQLKTLGSKSISV